MRDRCGRSGVSTQSTGWRRRRLIRWRLDGPVPLRRASSNRANVVGEDIEAALWSIDAAASERSPR